MLIDEFVPLVAAGKVHRALDPVILVRDVRGRAHTRTSCGEIVSYPDQDWAQAKNVCARCLPGETLESLVAVNT